MIMRLIWLLIPLALLCSCRSDDQMENKMVREEKIMEINITSSAFEEGGMIPVIYTCDGAHISPPLAWSPVPGGTESFALISDDPDAPRGTFTHWVAFNIPPDVTSLPEGVPTSEEFANGMKQGVNSAGKIGYTSPCPPSGIHRYYFKVYALDTKLELGDKVSKQDLADAMEGHVLGEGELMGRYTRK